MTTTNKQLSILLRPDGFSFYIINDSSEKDPKTAIAPLSFDYEGIAPQAQLDSLKQLFIENEVLAINTFDTVHIVHSNNLSTFVPKPFFNEKNMANYLKYGIKVLQNDFIVYDTIESAEMMNVYIPFVHLNNFFFEKFGSFVYKHSATVLVESLLKNSKVKSPAICYVNVEIGFFQITIIKDKKLLLYNAFNYKTKEDFIYYILFTAEQLEMNPDEFQLFLTGQIDKESVLYEVLYTYVRNIEFLPSSETIKEHQNYILLNQHL